MNNLQKREEKWRLDKEKSEFINEERKKALHRLKQYKLVHFCFIHILFEKKIFFNCLLTYCV